MKIKNIDSTALQIEKGIPVDGRKTGTNVPLEFHRQLTSLNKNNYEQYLSELIDNITKQGEIVAKKADMAEFQKYRELITKLLNETASNSFTCLKLDKFDINGRHKTFSIIKRINAKLDETASAILKEQSTNIQIINMVDNIRGMLIDLYL